MVLHEFFKQIKNKKSSPFCDEDFLLVRQNKIKGDRGHYPLLKNQLF
jgi:hypothetical protein